MTHYINLNGQYWCAYCGKTIDESVGWYHNPRCGFAKERGLKTMALDVKNYYCLDCMAVSDNLSAMEKHCELNKHQWAEIGSNVPRRFTTVDFNKEKNQEQVAYQEEVAIRHPQAIRYDILDPTFLEIMAKIADYGAKTYGDYNWQKSRLDGEKGPINHIYKHLTAYRLNKSYDHLEIGSDRKIHLAAIAFNAMMEFWNETSGYGPKQQNPVPPTL